MKTKEEKAALEKRICQALRSAFLAAIEEMDSNGLWDTLQYMAKRRSGATVESAPPKALANPDGLTEGEMSAVRGDSVITAIKMVRERTNLDLKQAKDLICNFRDLNGLRGY